MIVRLEGWRFKFFALVVLILFFVVAGCATQEDDEAQSPAAQEEKLKAAWLFLGTISDADWNASHHEAMTQVADEVGIDTSFSENVGVADAKRVARQFMAQGNEVIVLSSSAYFPSAMELAQEFPDTTFVSFVGAPEPPPEQPDNLWLFGLNFYPGEYVLGALGALESEKGKIAFIGGLELPSLIAGANGYFEGARAVDPDIELEWVFTGDFDDAAKGRDAGAALIRGGSDVLHVHLNAGVPGVVEAVRSADDEVNWTALYTDKNDLGPETFLGSIIYNFASAYGEAFSGIKGGTTTGYVDLGPMIDLSAFYNVKGPTGDKVNELLEGVKSGEIEVEFKPDRIEISK